MSALLLIHRDIGGVTNIPFVYKDGQMMEAIESMADYIVGGLHRWRRAGRFVLGGCSGGQVGDHPSAERGAEGSKERDRGVAGVVCVCRPPGEGAGVVKDATKYGGLWFATGAAFASVVLTIWAMWR